MFLSRGGKRTLKRVLLLFFLLSATEVLCAGQNSWIRIAGEVEKALQGAVRSYEAGKTIDAMERVADAYFGRFEAENANMEVAVRRFISLKRATDLEKGFADIRKAMSNRVPPDDVRKQTIMLIESLKEAGKELDKKGVRLDMSRQ